MATALLNDEYSKVSADKSVFIWAALSLYWAQLAANIPGKAKTEYGENRQFCPVCNSMPVSSMVQIGTLKDCVIYTVIYVRPNGTWYV